MADSMSFDTSQLRDLAFSVGLLPAAAGPAVTAVVVKSGVQMKAAMREEASGSTRFRRIPESINFDRVTTDEGVGVEVGPETRGQGSLAHIAYYGSPTSSPRFPDPIGVLLREADVTERFIAEAVEGLL